MDKHRQIAFIVAFIIALLIMMIGKSCTDNMVRKQSKTVRNSTSTTAPAYNNNSYNNNNYNNGYNNTPQQTTVTQQNEVPVQYVTNMFGEVVGTQTAVADIPSTVSGEVQTATQERSILEQYNENKQQNVSPNTVATSRSEAYQIPSEIKITIR
ncbi:MAG: hypothetical protein K2K02_04070 [Ruminococcus sp.]|nr:hypothetical protein [Ruminococcus sp.]